jgi:ketosteroid isomerase-like protein
VRTLKNCGAAFIVLVVVTFLLASCAAAGARNQRFIGIYAMTMPDQGGATRTLRIFEENGVFLGQINQNEPTRLLPVKRGVFRPEAAPGSIITFSSDGRQSGSVVIDTPEGKMSGTRLTTEAAGVGRDGIADQSKAGALYEELARADAALFQAAFVTCDSATVNAFLNDDVEFYHDQTGARVGGEVRSDFERLTSNCPGKQGVKRELVAGTLQVFPVKGDYAVQMGEHRFVPTTGQATVARFVHLWQRKNGTWKLARVLSFDHHPEPRK